MRPALLSLWFLGAASLAGEPRLSMDVDLVQASRGVAWIDPALSDVAADLKSLPYQHFTRIASAELPGTVGAPQQADLGQGVRIVLTLREVAEGSATVRVQLFRNNAIVTDTEIARPIDRAAVISVGREGDGVLVVPVRVHR